MTGPRRVEVHGTVVCLYGLDDPYPSRMTAGKAIELGRELVAAGELARKNEGTIGRMRPITTTRDEEQ